MFLVLKGTYRLFSIVVAPIYWVGQKVHFNFSISCYRKKPERLFGQSNTFPPTVQEGRGLLSLHIFSSIYYSFIYYLQTFNLWPFSSVLICISLIITDVAHLVTCPLAIQMSSLERHLWCFLKESPSICSNNLQRLMEEVTDEERYGWLRPQHRHSQHPHCGSRPKPRDFLHYFLSRSEVYC